MFNFQNNKDYIILSNTTVPSHTIKYFEVNNYNLDTCITTKNFSLDDITNFSIETKASLINSVNIVKNKISDESLTVNYMNTIKIELKEFIEYNSEDSTIKIIVNNHCIAGSIVIPNPLTINDEINVYINYISIHSNINNSLILSIVYTIYI